MVFVNRDYTRQPRGDYNLPQLYPGAKIAEVTAARTGNTVHGDTDSSTRVVPPRGDSWLNMMLGERRRAAHSDPSAINGPTAALPTYGGRIIENVRDGVRRRGQMSLQSNINSGLIDHSAHILDSDVFDQKLKRERKVPAFVKQYTTGFGLIVPKGRGPAHAIDAMDAAGGYTPTVNPKERLVNSINTRRLPVTTNIRSGMKTMAGQNGARNHMQAEIKRYGNAGSARVDMPHRGVVFDGARTFVKPGNPLRARAPLSVVTNTARSARIDASDNLKVANQHFARKLNSYGTPSRVNSEYSGYADPRALRSNMTSFVPIPSQESKYALDTPTRRAQALNSNTRLMSRPISGPSQVIAPSLPLGSRRVRKAHPLSAKYKRTNATVPIVPSRPGGLVRSGRDGRKVMGDLRNVKEPRVAPSVQPRAVGLIRPTRRPGAKPEINSRELTKPAGFRKYNGLVRKFTHVAQT